MRLSPRGAHLIETFEGFRAHPYHGQDDPAGLWTIGYGTTAGVGPNTPPMTPAQAQTRLMRDVDRRYAPVINALRLQLNQNQFDALVSFVYNVGPGGVAPTTHVGQALRRHDWRAAADGLLAWDMADGSPSPGLLRRREAERTLFLRRVGEAHDPTTPPHHHPSQSAELTPAELEAASHNGHVPASLLATVPGGHLRRDAAAAFNAMNGHSEREYGITLSSEGPLGTYRTVPEQQSLYSLYQEGRGAQAAVPGTSNHGLGLAIDLATRQMRQIVDEIGASYGWAKRWSDAPQEWWHLRYRPGVWQAPPSADPRRRNPRTEATAVVQQLLRTHGFPTLRVDGRLTPATRSALLQFQRTHGLEATGELDHATDTALRHGSPATDHDRDPAPVEPARAHPAHKPTPTHTHTYTHHHAPGGSNGRPDPNPNGNAGMNPDASEQPILNTPNLPLNRILALLGPFIAIASGGVASWLSQNFPGLVTNVPETTAGIIQGVTFVVGAAIAWALQHKYLDGWQRWEGGLLAIELAKQTPAPHAPLAEFEPWQRGSAGHEGYESFDIDPRLLDAAVGRAHAG